MQVCLGAFPESVGFSLWHMSCHDSFQLHDAKERMLIMLPKTRTCGGGFSLKSMKAEWLKFDIQCKLKAQRMYGRVGNPSA